MNSESQTPGIGVGIAGLGTIGFRVAQELDRQGIAGMHLAGVASGSREKAQRTLAGFRAPPAVVSIGELASSCRIVVDCAPKAAFAEIAESTLLRGGTLVTVSGAAILENEHFIDLAKRHGGRIILATGALLGLDAIRAAAEGEIRSVAMVTRKPPRSLAGAPYLEENGIDVLSATEAIRVFSGSAAEGALGFPSNVNVAAAVGLAGIGADHTSLEIWCDPDLDRNTHTISVDADSARFSMKIENVPSEGNPGTGKITALSVIAALRAETSALRVGT